MGGSFYLFGYFRMLSRLLPILEKYGFELRQQIVLNKGMQAVSGRATKNYRMFPNVTESIPFLNLKQLHHKHYKTLIDRLYNKF